MVRKHFETSAKGKINKGKLIKSGQRYNVRYMGHDDIKHSLALQQNVISTLKALGKTHYILPKDKLYLQQLLNKGNAIIGTFVNQPQPGQSARLAARMLILCPQKESDTGLDDAGVLPDKDLDTISVV